ncbi:MAG: hypothetical protein ACK5JF_12970 [Oscillospiraceae bacterium]
MIWKNKRKIIGLVAVLFVLALVMGLLCIFNPFAPLIVVLSLLIQAPLIYGIGQVVFGKSYQKRTEERREKFLKDNNLDSFLLEEEKEAKGPGFAYWSLAGKYTNYLNRAELLLLAQRQEDAMQLLAQVDPRRLRQEDKERYLAILNNDKSILPD